MSQRPLLRFALAQSAEPLAEALRLEEGAERERDRTYWGPLRRELEELRHGR